MLNVELLKFYCKSGIYLASNSRFIEYFHSKIDTKSCISCVYKLIIYGTESTILYRYNHDKKFKHLVNLILLCKGNPISYEKEKIRKNTGDKKI